MKDSVVEELRSIVGDENVSMDQADLITYSRDCSIFSQKPELVIWPSSVEQVAEVLKVLNKHKIPVTPRGSGTSRTGGAIPSKGGVVLVTTKMRKILDIDPINFQMYVECGATISEICERLRREGFFFPLESSEREACTTGGCIAEASSGFRSIKYGSFKSWVTGLDIVLPKGELVSLGSGRSSGYDLMRLMIGSEGTLGVIVRAKVKIFPTPTRRIGLIASFSEMKNACDSAFFIMHKRLAPSALDILDPTSSSILIEKLGLDLPPEFCIIAEFEGGREAKKARDTCKKENALDCRLMEAKEDEDMWNARKSIFSLLSSSNPCVIDSDVTVPIGMMSKFMKKAYELAEKYRLRLVIYGHAGSGNIHPCILFDKRYPRELNRAIQMNDEILNVAISLKGSISGEFGIGMLKAKHLKLEHSEEEISMMRIVKKTLDPNWILNPGKVFLQ